MLLGRHFIKLIPQVVQYGLLNLVPFTKGQVIVSKKGECHGAKNTGTEDIVFVSIVAPVPADYDPVNTN